jgi:hypothetical protein
MNNPNYPHRKICHADLLTKAGFKIDMAWYEIQPVKPIMVTNCGKLIYWKRGETHITLFDYQKISLNTLISRVIEQTKYNMAKKARVVFNNE